MRLKTKMKTRTSQKEDEVVPRVYEE